MFIDDHLDCFHFSVLFIACYLMQLQTWVYKYLLKPLLSLLLDLYPEVELLSCVVVLFSVAWGVTKLFSMVTEPFHICTCHSTQGFQFLHFLSNTYLLIFKNNLNYNLCNLNYNLHPNDCEVVSQCGKTFRFLDVIFEMPERYSHGIVQ